MADRTPAEIAQLVQDLRHLAGNFTELDEQEREMRQLAAGTRKYAEDLARLIPWAREGIPVLHTGLGEKLQLIQSILSWPFSVTVSQDDKLTEDAKKENDDAEAFFGGEIARTFSTDVKQDAIYAGQTRRRFGVVKIDLNGYAPPRRKQGEDRPAYLARVKEYRSRFHRFTATKIDPATVAFLTRDSEVEVALIDEEVDAIELGRRRPSDSPEETEVSLIEKRFDRRLAVGTGVMVGQEGWTRQKVRRVIVLDDECETIWVAQRGTGRDRDKLEWIKDEYATVYHNLKQVPLLIFRGVYDEFSPMSERYGGVGYDFGRAYHQWNVSSGLRRTLALNQLLFNEQDADHAIAYADLQERGLQNQPRPEQTTPQGQRERAQNPIGVLGKVVNPHEELDAHFKAAEDDARAEIEELTTRILAFNPRPETIEQATAAGVLSQIEMGLRRFEFQHGQIVANMRRFCLMVAADIAFGDSKYWQPDERDRIGYEVKESYQEYYDRRKQNGSRKLSRSFFARIGDDVDVAVQLKTDSASVRAAKVQIELEKKAVGLATAADVLKADGEEDVSGKLVELDAENNSGIMAPAMKQSAFIDQLRFDAILSLGPAATDQDVEDYILQRLPQIGADTGGGGNSAPGSLQNNVTRPPGIDSPQPAA